MHSDRSRYGRGRRAPWRPRPLFALSLPLATLIALVAAPRLGPAVESLPWAQVEPAAARSEANRTGPDRARRLTAAATTFASDRAGIVSFAWVDGEGRTHGYEEDRTYVSASIVKALMLVAELRRLDAADAPLDATTRSLLTSMITWSDNAAADAIYARLGDDVLRATAAGAGMRKFDVFGHWTTAQVSAGDLARLMLAVDRMTPARFVGFARETLAGVVEGQRWGIPAVAPGRFRVMFKGGWRGTDIGQLVHQAALLESGRRRMALAVLTDGQPTQQYGIDTVAGIAARVLVDREAPPARG